jgi:hypothetical protein
MNPHSLYSVILYPKRRPWSCFDQWSHVVLRIVQILSPSSTPIQGKIVFFRLCPLLSYLWLEGKGSQFGKVVCRPSWTEKQPTHRFEIPLQMAGAGMKEPTCPNHWCLAEHTTKWSGPGEEGYWIAPNMEKFPFEPKKVKCEESDAKCEW